jgi:hypothetical protein
LILRGFVQFIPLCANNINNLGSTPAEIQRNQKLVDNNNQDYARIDKSKGEDFLFITATAAAAAFLHG